MRLFAGKEHVNNSLFGLGDVVVARDLAGMVITNTRPFVTLKAFDELGGSVGFDEIGKCSYAEFVENRAGAGEVGTLPAAVETSGGAALEVLAGLVVGASSAAATRAVDGLAAGCAGEAAESDSLGLVHG